MLSTDFASANDIKKFLRERGVTGVIAVRKQRPTPAMAAIARDAKRQGWWWFVGIEFAQHELIRQLLCAPPCDDAWEITVELATIPPEARHLFEK